MNVLLDTCSFTTCLWLSGGVPSGVPSLQFGHCCVRTNCRCVAFHGFIVATDVSVLPHSHARTYCSGGGLSNCSRAAEVHSWPVCPYLMQTKQCLQCWRHSNRWSCLQQPLLVGQCGGWVLLLSVPTWPSQPALSGVYCHATAVSLEVTSPDCPSVWQSECVGCSVVTGGQRAWRGVWWCPCIIVCHYLRMLLCEANVSAHP